ncbi:MAG: class II glutamine amidotransferase [bacterium]
MEILLIISLVFWLLKKPSNTLYCGIFAWTGDSNKKFNWDKFNILGILNNERGGDSCGRVSGNISQYGIYKTSDYYDFLEQNESFPVKEKMIIGHDRKASFGYAVTENNAQPVVLKENGEIVFVLAHNGTVYNIDDLAKKYGIDKYNKTDSWVLAKIIYDNGFDVLKEYEGAAALVMYDRRKYLETGDTFINVFKGKSKSTEHVKYPSEERPLYILDRGNNSLYFSSISSALYSIGGKKDSVYDLECNKVFTFKNGIPLPLFIEIDRAEMTQVKTYKKTTQYPAYPSYVNNNRNFNNGYDEWDDGYGSYGGENCWKDKYKNNETKLNIDNETFPYLENKIDFKRGLFCNKQGIINGIIHLNKEGDIVEPKDKEGVPFYFINGVMVTDHDEHNRASRAIKTANAVNPEDMYPILLRYSVYPIYFDTGSPKGKCYYRMDRDGTRHVYTGELQPVFSSYKYNIKNGVAVSSEYVNTMNRLFPSRAFENKNKIENENFPSLEYNKDFEEENYKHMESQMTEQEVSHILADVLESLGKARTNLGALGSDPMINVLIENLNTIEDSVFLQENGNLYKKTLKLTTIWEKAPF